MPLSRITTNFKLEHPDSFVEDYHAVLLSVLNIPDYDRLVILDEKENGFYQPTNTTGNYMMIEISLFAGRTIETKRQLYKQLVALVSQYDINPLNVRIVLYESTVENWGIRGGQAASDVALGYKTTI